LNAANEVAVECFLQRRIRFDQIHAVNLQTLTQLLPPTLRGLEDLLQLDQQARRVAEGVARAMAS
jgi:1-deoxy-D-xylulose-5-phosphate reductoisomerase